MEIVLKPRDRGTRQFGTSQRDALLAEATALRCTRLTGSWLPKIDKTFKNGTFPRTPMVCHGALQACAVGNCAANRGDMDLEEEKI
jgi:hypothetical protein